MTRLHKTINFATMAAAGTIAGLLILPQQSLAQRYSSEQPSPRYMNGPMGQRFMGTQNVNLVVYGNRGQRFGSFMQYGPRMWVQKSETPGGGMFRFRELDRDRGSVHLYDSSRNLSIQLDLFARRVMYSDAATPEKREMYEILDRSSRMTGRLASMVQYTAGDGSIIGAFVRRDHGEWVEVASPSGEEKFHFREVGRDDWSVYLSDRSRNIEVQLDLHTMQVLYTPPGGMRRPLYAIAAAPR